MTEQLSLDAAPVSRSIEDVTAKLLAPHAYLQRRPKATSVKAARRVLSQTALDRFRVLAYFARFPSTDERAQSYLAMPGNTLRPRRLELVRDDYLEDSGRTALTVSGGEAVIWQATDLGHRALAEVEARP